MKARITALMLGCIALAGAILARAVFVQIIPDARLQRLADRQFQSKVLLRPRRGPIVDRNGEPLAVSVETNSLAASPSKISQRRERAMITRLLAKALDIPPSRLSEKLSNKPNEKRDFVWIKRHLSDAETDRLKRWKIIDPSGNLVEGLWLVRESKRVYPHGELAAQVLGDVNVDSEGMEGVELWQDETLKGRVASVTAIRDALGRPTFIDAGEAKGLKDGAPIKLTLDASLQFSVETELKASLAKTGAKAGTVVVMNAATGEILALANAPFFNPNQRGASADRRRNRALTDGYEPGSTLKAVLLASALSHGSKLTDVVWGERGQFTVQGKKISEAEAHEKFEWLSLKKIIQVSSNVGAAKLALKIGADNYLSTLRAFGFGAKTATGFPGEIAGRVPARKQWQPLTTANIGFGQGILVTPLQMTRAYAAFANGGLFVTPSLVAPEKPFTDKPVRVLSPKVADAVTSALVSVTEEGGTGTKAALEGYRVAGKTGTAQMVDPATGGYSRSRYYGSFIGYAVGIEPRVVVFAGLQEPKSSIYGAETAAPLFQKVLTAVVTRFGMPAPAQPQLASTSTEGGASDRILKDRIGVKSAHPAPPVEDPVWQWEKIESDGKAIWKMPSLEGLTAREALKVLKGRRLAVEVRGFGVVKGQSPPAGGPVSDGATIRLAMGDP